MNKKLIIAIVITFMVIGAIFFKLMLFDDEYMEDVIEVKEEQTVVSSPIIDNFKANMEKDLRFLPLDYMNEPEIEKCKKLHDILVNNYKTAEYIVGEYAKDADELHAKMKPTCLEGATRGWMHQYFLFDYYFFKLNNNDILVAGKTPSEFRLFAPFSRMHCRIDASFPRKAPIGTDNSIVAKIDGEYYLISEWDGPEKYVFYYLDKSEEYDQINCRFDVKKD